MENFQNLDFLSVGVTVAAIGILGFVIFINNRRSLTNIAFLSLSLMTIIYGVLNYISYQVFDTQLAFKILRWTIFFAVWHAFSMFQLFYVFPKDKITLPRWYWFGLLPVTIFVSLMNLTPFVLKSIGEVSTTGRIISVNNGPGIIIFGGVITCLILSGFFVLIRKIFLSRGTERIQLSLIFAGALATFSLLVIFNFIFPAILDNADFIPLAAVFMFPFIACTFYAILKHGFLRVKVVAAEILTFALAVITIFDVILSDKVSTLILRSGIFSLVLGFGILLIQGVLREVIQREKLEILTKELETANQKLKELDKLKSEFLSFASHQVKAPMTAIKGFASLIIDGNYGQVSDKVKEVIGKIKDSTDRMIMLVNNLLDLRRIEEGRMDYKFEETNIFKLVLDIMDEFKPLAQKKGLTLKFDSEPLEGILVNIDSQKFSQAVQNLIENAIKYTEKGGIEITINKETDNSTLITISDSGRGISKELLPNLFEQYKREESLAKQIEGTGLGLYIAKVIVLAHKGKIWAESEGEGRGSKFFIKLPVS